MFTLFKIPLNFIFKTFYYLFHDRTVAISSKFIFEFNLRFLIFNLLLKLNEKEEYINFVDFNIASKILQLHDVLKDAVEEIAAGDYDSVQTEISTSIYKVEEIIDIYDEEY